MEITYHGGNRFVLTGTCTVAFDPVTKTQYDLALYSAPRKGGKLIVNGQGEYEIGGVLIATLQGDPTAPGLFVHAVDLDGITVLHSGAAPFSPSESDLLTIGKVDILITGMHDAKRIEALVQDVMPRVVIPYGPGAAAICGTLGVKDPVVQTKLHWNGVGSVPRAVLLKPQIPRKPGTRAHAA